MTDRTTIRILGALAAVALSACVVVIGPENRKDATVFAIAETDAVASSGDAADDPAIWRNPQTPEQSLVLGTDKQAGLYVYGLSGEVRQFIASGRLNNVDLRSGWGEDGESVLVTASDRTRKGVAVFELSPQTREVTPLGAGFIPSDLLDPYGLCLHKSAENKFEITLIGKSGEVRQIAIAPASEGFSAREINRFAVGSQSEGCVVDDRTGSLYIGEENVGIWRYDSLPSDSEARVQVAAIDGVELSADVEGLALAPMGASGGYLVASSQGDSAFAFYRLPDGVFAGRVRVEQSSEGLVDRVTGTDGIDLALGDFGADYPGGLFVVQDDENEGAVGQNYKYLAWQEVLAALEG